MLLGKDRHEIMGHRQDQLSANSNGTQLQIRYYTPRVPLVIRFTEICYQLNLFIPLTSLILFSILSVCLTQWSH